MQLKASTRQSTIPVTDPILLALSVPCEMRSKQDLAPIVEFVKGLKFFHSFSSYPETVAKIASRLELRSYLNGTHIFNEGEPGDLFFVILDGEVTIMKKKRLSQFIDLVTENVALVKLSSGQHFGENALDNKDGLRSASAVATKACNLLVLHRDDYQSILSFFRVQLREAVKKTLCLPSSIFNHLSEVALDKLSEVAVVRTFPPNACIFQAGTRVSSLMIVKSGLVRLLKAVYRSDVKQLTRDVDIRLKSMSNASSSFLFPKSPTNRNKRGSTSSVCSTGGSSTASNSISPTLLGSYYYAMPATAPAASSKPSLLIDQMEDTPPGYWILMRSDDYIAASRTQYTSSKFRSAASMSAALAAQTAAKTAAATVRNQQIQQANQRLHQQHNHSHNNNHHIHHNNNHTTHHNHTYQSHSTPQTPRLPSPKQHQHRALAPTARLGSMDLAEEDRRSIRPNSSGALGTSSNNNGGGKSTKDTATFTRIAFTGIDIDSNTNAKLPAATSKHGNHHRHHHNANNVPLAMTSGSGKIFTDPNEIIEFTVAVLMSGDVFGEMAILDPEYPSPVTALASTAVEIYCIDYDILVELGILKDERIMKSLLDDWKFRNPPPQEINKRFQAKYEWEIKRKHVLQPFKKNQKEIPSMQF